MKHTELEVVQKGMVLDRNRSSSPPFSGRGDKLYRGRLPLKEIITITFLKHERPFGIRGDKKVSRKQKAGPE